MKKYIHLLYVALFATISFSLYSCSSGSSKGESSTAVTSATETSAATLNEEPQQSYWYYTTKVDPSTGEKNHIAGVNSVNTYELNGRNTPLRLTIMDGYGNGNYIILGLDEGCVFADNGMVICCFDDGDVLKAPYQRTDNNLIYVGYDEQSSKVWIDLLKKSNKLELNVPMADGTDLIYFFPTAGLKWD